MATMAITVTTGEKGIAGDNYESHKKFNEPDIINFSDPQKQDLREKKETGESKASVDFEKGAALMLQGDGELFGELPK